MICILSLAPSTPVSVYVKAFPFKTDEQFFFPISAPPTIFYKIDIKLPRIIWKGLCL